MLRAMLCAAAIAAGTAGLAALPTSASASTPLTLEQARKAAMQKYAQVLAVTVKSNACYWRAKFAKSIGPGDSPAAAYTRCMLKRSHMSRPLRRCLIAAGITAGGIAVGGIIGGVASRVIAGGIVGGGSSACLTQIAL